MSKTSSQAAVLMATFFVLWPYSNISFVYAQALSDEQKKSRINELRRTDEFNIRAALKRALDADNPEVIFHWHNPHTKHSGTIVTLSPIGQGDSGETCVDLVHVFYLGESSGGRHETTICRDSSGNWNDTRTHIASSAPSHLQLYAEQTIIEVQNALTQLNYAPGSVDGVYGGKTRRAIEEFQRDQGLPVTGNISDALLIAIKQSDIVLQSKQPTITKEVPQSSDTDRVPNSNQSVRSALQLLSTRKRADNEPASASIGEKAHRFTDEESPIVVDAATTPSLKTEVSAATTENATPAVPVSPESSSIDTISGTESPNSLATVNTPDLTKKETPVVAKAETVLANTTSSPTTPGSISVAEPYSAGATSNLVDPAPKTSILGDKTLSVPEQLKKLASMAESFDSHWFFFAGFAICCLVGAFASWFFTPRVNHITIHRTQLEPDEDELKAKIALVTRRLDQSPAPPKERSHSNIKAQSPTPGDIQGMVASKQPDSIVTPKPSKAAFSTSYKSDTTQAPAVNVPVDDAWLENRLEKIVPKVEKPKVERKVEQPTTQEVPTPSQDATETIKQADEFIDIIEAIKEAEDLIREAQQILKEKPIEGASKDYITNAIKQATELIKEALNTGPIEGGSSKEITKALKNASVLIKQSLTKGHIDSASQLRLT